ncbi:acetyl-CoA carboxylase biotin carboxyl carrier protein subunit [Clostridium thermosuccinogenes]|jgi:biotin carboxyl carrier protein|uniref:Acetyl-CoA carboxylase biotin carboxyl carrier protein subunit n=1 Tax=Clostridium thermosuccinogenes TaxID=84032 RepID=A0A2K2F2S2_9CLOT|nr:biotin/lipoyl-containing protein [Pseudoclostridium thermosuccinogenes]AUS96241.1 acetyl-CoA carboxylase biotin carboxyl carrier protein subunit [Pseudoclostridium thermosuccinogenes]PNT93079.1 acetyl-CoA carboxylase biotin carboxyl carrier protein subunit [Pseudoclostridium thermosuccinogenes]PNT96384.1 acetyl-CoA carboxylase biotin carboxyl carrier protein subunit [Pseudoclostridium thermosuccinogenes]PNT98037.1 acetyl-CoA carboxylase biotin carboxyl carrier protein subunit [Pseudoclostrid
MKKFLIKVNGSQYEVEVEEIRGEGAAVQPAVAASPAPAAAPKPAAAAAPAQAPAPKPAEPKRDTAVPAGAQTITAPMPGTILRVDVNTGDQVKRGQVLLILEAMKMENEIVAPSDGKIASVNVTKGTSVNAGDVLVSMV